MTDEYCKAKTKWYDERRCTYKAKLDGYCLIHHPDRSKKATEPPNGFGEQCPIKKVDDDFKQAIESNTKHTLGVVERKLEIFTGLRPVQPADVKYIMGDIRDELEKRGDEG